MNMPLEAENSMPTPSDRKIAESILLLADEPVPARLIGEVLERPSDQVEALLEELARSYEREERGFVLRRSQSGWRLYTDPACAPWLERFVRGHSFSRLTGAALEVLAIVCYRGPLSRSQIGDIRGVNSDGVVKTLAQRGLLVETGKESGPGNPSLFAVSDEFVERLGLGSLDELPPLADFMPDAEAVEDMEAKLSPNV
jgi:segregation and condensation protein B